MQQAKYKEQIDQWVDAHTGQMLEDLKALVRIPSVRGVPAEGMPYGEMPAKAVSTMQKLMEGYGFETANYENHCVTADLEAGQGKALDILAHLDVVPVSDNWTKTTPFEPYIEGDRIYGRGTSDDKGPAIAALYAMRCVKELNLPLEKGVRLICGSDEESGSADLEYYYSQEQEALYTFSPDADYPLINIEKGRLQKSFFAKGQGGSDAARRADGMFVRSIHAGDTVNIVPGDGEVVLSGASESVIQRAAEKTLKKEGLAQALQAAGGGISWSQRGEESVIRFAGKSAHAAHPSDGINAVMMILEFLKHLELAQTDGHQKLMELAKLWPHGEYQGESLDVSFRDEESGALTISLDILNYEGSADGSCRIEGSFDCRAPLCCTDETLTRTVHKKLAEAGFEMEEGGMTPGHYVSADSELVRKLLESYELYFGKKGTPVAIGGGTYVHELERGVAFGCAVPEVDNRMHGDDEFMEIPMLVRSTKIFADAIMRLCGA